MISEYIDYTQSRTGFATRDQALAVFRRLLPAVGWRKLPRGYDLSNWDNSVAVNVPGQSGQPTSPHYSDLLPLWSEGRYFRFRIHGER
jgi:acyl-homoserine lactone acylase PvdQ